MDLSAHSPINVDDGDGGARGGGGGDVIHNMRMLLDFSMSFENLFFCLIAHL